MWIIIALILISILPLWVMVSNDNYDDERRKKEERLEELRKRRELKIKKDTN